MEFNKVYRVIDNWLNKFSDAQWYYDEEKINYLLKKKRLTDFQVNSLKTKIIPVLEEIFDDKFHLRLSLIADFSYKTWYVGTLKVVIHYPTLTISNEQGYHTTVHNHFQEHNIHFGVEEGYGSFCPHNELWGLTVNPTYKQYRKGYAHSHLRSTSYTSLYSNTYCLGDSQDFHSLRNILYNPNSNDYDTWYLFFANLKTIAETESLSGVPYIKLGSMEFGDNLSNNLLPDYNITSYMQEYDRKENKSAINWSMNDGLISAVDDEELEQHCLIYGQSTGSYPNASSTVVHKDEFNNYYSRSATNTRNYDNINWEYTNFKGIPFKFGVVNSLNNVTSKIYIHPQIKKYVKSRLENKANRFSVKKILEGEKA